MSLYQQGSLSVEIVWRASMVDFLKLFNERAAAIKKADRPRVKMLAPSTKKYLVIKDNGIDRKPVAFNLALSEAEDLMRMLRVANRHVTYDIAYDKWEE
jgi:hypothetical protein